MFPLVRKACVEKIILIIIEQLTCLENIMEEYFPSISIDNFYWIRNNFVNLTVINPLSLKISAEKELVNIFSDRSLKVSCKSILFYAKKALKVLLQPIQLHTYVNWDFLT